MPQLTPDNIRKYAQMLYIYEGKDVPELSDMLSMPRETLYNWRKKHLWEESRDEHRYNAGEIARMINVSIKKILDQSHEKNNGILTGPNADAIGKLNKVRVTMLKDANYMGIAFDAIQKLQKYMRRKHPKFINEKLVDVMGEFLKDMMVNL